MASSTAHFRRRELPMQRQAKNLPVDGRRYGRFVVQREIEPELRPNGRGNIRRVNALCDCGAERIVHLQNLTSGKSLSCGCLSAVLSTIRATKHGESDSAEYRIWRGMLNRCYNPNVERYPQYGGRGIKVCEWWRTSFEAFLADMGRRPSPLHSIDRYPDNDGDYELSNCRWATKRQQRLNQRPRSYRRSAPTPL